MPTLARLHLAARESAAASQPQAMPPTLHSESETVQWLMGNLPRTELWVAEIPDEGGDDDLLGYAELEDGWLNALYVDPAHQRGGVGTMLLDLVKARRPQGFALWVFETNRPARDFYAASGLVELDHTDGSGNEEQAPDLRMAWLGLDPLGYLTGELAVVDRTLRELHERRQALLSRLANLPGGASTRTR
ncbi:GNAT family N-acetyltransferase [Nocardioides mangrovicus]|uniref:GNAT family N-acetyltransferase n=1 Tax=Nocardioides mangrovicus TaxID=2478913 RepID=A0A3L8P2A8_9ACTN|nr:GNAT family N-acetyltransferase [Nocardioides mangrovicus]